TDVANGLVGVGEHLGKESGGSVRYDERGFPERPWAEDDLGFPAKPQHASCPPCPDGAAARVDPNARLRRKDRPAPEHALPRRRGRSTKLHLSDPLVFGGLAAPGSPPTLLWKGS